MPPPPQSPVTFFRQLLAMTAKEREDFSDQPPAGNPRAHPRQGPRISRARPGRTRTAAERDGTALVSAAAAARIADEPRRAPGAGAGQPPRSGQKPARTMGRAAAAVPAGIFGQRTDAGLFLRTWIRPMPPPIPASGPSDAEQARWNALSEDERQKITAQFNQFFELTPDEKQNDAQHAVRRRARPNGKDAAIVRQIAARAARPVHSRLHAICRHESGGTRGISEKRRALVAIAAQGTPGLARPGGAGAAVAAAATRGHRYRRCRPRCRRARIRPWPPTVYDLGEWARREIINRKS